MDTAAWIIVAVAVVVLLAISGYVITRRLAENRRDAKRTRAAELREQASATHSGIKKKQAEADETVARAEAARAEADIRQAEAKRLEAEAADKRATLSEHVDRRDGLLREADELDPDTPSGDAAGNGAEEPAGHRKS